MRAPGGGCAHLGCTIRPRCAHSISEPRPQPRPQRQPQAQPQLQRHPRAGAGAGAGGSSRQEEQEQAARAGAGIQGQMRASWANHGAEMRASGGGCAHYCFFRKAMPQIRSSP
eukprot:12410249-Karenia_brevis.AAC.1